VYRVAGRDLYFLDTPIVLYCFDHGDPRKQLQAKELLTHAASSGLGVVSYQVLQEFCNVATSSKTLGVSIERCMAYVNQLLQPISKVSPSPALLEKALYIRHQTHYSFHQSLMIACAIEAGCNTLYSEDMQHHHMVSGVRIVNPFLQVAQSPGA